MLGYPQKNNDAKCVVVILVLERDCLQEKSKRELETQAFKPSYMTNQKNAYVSGSPEK